jgi:succinate dehydrogenase/fumarate reductase flavoprotein subunit
MRITVVGGGLAGLVATRRALELGARVTLLEKGDRLGGSFVYSSGYVWSYKDLPTFRTEAPGGDVALQELILDRLGRGLSWLEGLGAPLLTRETGNPLTVGARFAPGPTVAALSDRIAASGGRVLLGAALESLVQDARGQITGVRAASAEERWTEEADAVILASGGFAANPELVGRHIIRGPGSMRLRAHPWSTGDGFLAALAAGARESAGLDEFYGRNLPAPPAAFPPERFVEVSQLYGRYAVALNRNGERYADEAGDWSETALTRATVCQPGLRAWYLVDDESLRRRVRERTVAEMVATAREVGGTVLEAGSLEQLAQKLAQRGMPADRVVRTLDDYNAAVAGEKAAGLSPPRSEPTVPVKLQPLVAVEVAPTITHTIGGLAVDEGCRVLRRSDGHPIQGLYAAGVEVGGVSVGGYTSGLAAAVVFGRVAAESVFQHFR